MQKKTVLLGVLGILFSFHGMAMAISSEPVYTGNPEEYLRTEFSKLGFSGIMISKDGSGKDLFNLSLAGFNPETSN